MKRWIATAALLGATATGGTVIVDEQINPYEDKGTHYELPIVSDIPQGERVEIAKDKAAVDLIGWNDEYRITITPQIPSAPGLLGAEKREFDTPADRPLLSKRMEFTEGDVTAFVEPREGSQNEFDIDFTLKSNPGTNVFTYKIEGADEFDFFPQGFLTPEEIADGTSRPENVEGSIAVYHKTKANHRVGSTNYATGKAFHIYRPKAIDANGAEVWAELNYNNDTLSVTVPEKFLEGAVYPVVVDPTFGKTTTGATVNNFARQVGGTDEAIRKGRAFTAPENGTLDSVTAYTDAEVTLTMTTFYSVNTEDAAANSHAEVASAEASTGYTTTDTWKTINLGSQNITGNTSYVLTISGNATAFTTNNEARIFSDTTATANSYSESFTGGSLYTSSKEDPWTVSDLSNTIHLSIYATYTAEATDVYNIASSNATASSGTSASATKPTGTAADDVIIAFVHANDPGSTQAITDNNGATPFTDSGLGARSYNSGSGLYKIYYRVAGGSEPASYAWTLNSSDRWTVILSTYRGVDTGNVFDVAPTSGSENVGTGVTNSTDAITTLTDGARVVAVLGIDVASDSITATPSTFASREVSATSQPAALADKGIPSITTQGSVSWTSAGNAWVTNVFALKPAGAGGGDPAASAETGIFWFD